MTRTAKKRTIAAGEFKAKCLELMDRVAETGETIVITKRGTAVAELTPVPERRNLWGLMEGQGEIVGDVVSPLDVDWGPRPPGIPRRKR
jgi:prevent-host-death family protein